MTKGMGHKVGADTLKNTIENASNLGVKYLTVYAFSTENWTRSEKEIKDLMNLLREYIDMYIKDVDKNDVKISIIGDKNKLDLDLQQKIEKLIDLTSNKKGINVIIAINYGGRDEIVRATKNILTDIQNNKLDISEIDKKFSFYLDTKNIPDPDLLIRTSGEMRISNFLLWQMAYTEMYFTGKLWPDFDNDELLKAVEFYEKRERRFGGR